ncbi:MAG: hypothetical protein ACJA2O_003977, partial [Candidatus Azotimanducaceae bacterium]|jgi:hypothetical protein
MPLIEQWQLTLLWKPVGRLRYRTGRLEFNSHKSCVVTYQYAGKAFFVLGFSVGESGWLVPRSPDR